MCREVGKVGPSGAALHEASKASEDDAEQRAQARFTTYVGFVLLAYGLGSVSIYALVQIPMVVWMSLTVAVLGGVIVASELRVDDPVFFGKKASELIVVVIKAIRHFFWYYGDYIKRICTLCCTPDLKPEDAEDLLISTPRTAASVPASVPAPASAAAFDESVDWLQRPELNLGFEDQLYLHSLYLQAKGGNCSDVTAKNSGVLDQAVHEGWLALHGLPQQTASERLPTALAELDAGFAAAHPRLSARRPGPTSATTAAAQLVLRRVPSDLDGRVLRSQRGLVAALGSATALAAIAALRWRRRSWAGMATVGAALTGYTAMTAHGLPAWLLAFVAQWRFGLRKAVVARATAGKPDAAALLLKLLLRMLSPRVAVPLFAKNMAGKI